MKCAYAERHILNAQMFINGVLIFCSMTTQIGE
jgi:hypothetical protein